ncbi:MAG TPA: DUF2127 domain-containing protein [Candidatus Angelobacter sp.]|nr:DUF2127 domain-containing protein [Candidatus Angelobacter sp.]
MNTEHNLVARHFGLRGIAMLEAIKGLFAIVVAIWLLSLLHKDLQNVAEHLLYFLHKIFHLNPDGRFARALVRGARRITPGNLHLWIGGTLAYASIRFTEATGLWLEKSWAEWFALVSGGLYIPIEIYELTHRPNPIKWGVLIVNVLIVIYLAWLLRDSHNQKKLGREAVSPTNSSATTKPVPQTDSTV